MAYDNEFYIDTDIEEVSYIYNIIKNFLLPERYQKDKEYDVFIDLLSRVIGQALYFKNQMGNMNDVEKVDERFLKHIAGNYGYDIPSETSLENVRLFIKYFLSLRRRRGTINSIINAVRFAGRDEYSLLYGEEGIDISIEELEGEGLFYIEGSNINFDMIMDSLEKVKPAGTKWTYALRYTLPFIDYSQDYSNNIFIRIGEESVEQKIDSLIINIDSESGIVNLSESLQEDIFIVNFISDSNVKLTNIEESDLNRDLNKINLIEDSNLISFKSDSNDSLLISIDEEVIEGINSQFGVAVYGTSIYGS